MEFKCYYRSDLFSRLTEVVRHIEGEHSGDPLKFRKLVLDEATGKRKFVSKDFRLTPAEINKAGQEIEVNDGSGKITIKNKTFVDPSNSESVDQSQSECEASKPEGLDAEINRLLEILPNAAQRLKEQGLLSTWLLLHELICEGTFPLNNISFLLFLDVVRFYSEENTSSMRYREETKLFWRTGYHLFHGKFIRFMGGPKNQGQVVDGSETLGVCRSSCAKINFAIPSLNHLETDEIQHETLKPGILHDTISILSETPKVVKVAFDAKKINSSLSQDQGDIDLFGHELSPTLMERRDRLVKELDSLEEMLMKVDTHQLSPTDLHAAVLTVSVRIKELRELAVLKNEGVKKFKELGQPDWRASKYSYSFGSPIGGFTGSVSTTTSALISR
ncbi:uncharacterized protein [Littorina saxatilis]|uniref:uncharacterized protein n=1 Tax=Littorina saxatilis TaxID=31220 RepID=UPI0038B597CD